jgi:malate dehydrogenase (NAD) (EC 1.1.1.37)
MPDNMPGEGLGHFLGAMRIDGFRPADEFKQHMDNWITRFKNAVPSNPAQPVLVPGDPERGNGSDPCYTGHSISGGCGARPGSIE